ncbi:hypothetical protein NMY22_g14919 [Coprinellus aureogranulatus]|nr:hypothetical protein NMY22_g14919 [Coprinellus aureogranulatus]
MQSEDNPVTTKPSDSVGLGVVDITHDSGAEVPIPVLADNESVPPPPPIPKMHVTSPSVSTVHRKHAPGMSISKAPAPRPVDLPTQDDIETPPITGPEDDLEAGRSSLAMREFSDGSGPMSAGSTRSYAPLRRETSDFVGSSAIPSSPPPELDQRQQSTSVSSPATIVPDLLVEDSNSKIKTVPLQPSPSSSSTSAEANATPLIDTTPAIDGGEPPHKESSGSPVPNGHSADGVGVTGLPDGDAAKDGDVTQTKDSQTVITDDNAEDAATPAETTAPPASEKPKHKKNKSSAATVKKAAQRKDSAASTKDTVTQ